MVRSVKNFRFNKPTGSNWISARLWFIILCQYSACKLALQGVGEMDPQVGGNLSLKHCLAVNMDHYKYVYSSVYSILLRCALDNPGKGLLPADIE